MKIYREMYLRYCAELNDGFTQEDVKRHNIAMEQLSELFHRIEKESDKSFLLELLCCKNDRVRLTVASHCLGFNEYVEEATKTLLALMTSEYDGDVAFNAKMTLKVWEQQGYLSF